LQIHLKAWYNLSAIIDARRRTMGKDDARQGRIPILTPSELKQGIVNLGEALLPKPNFGVQLGSTIGEGLPVQGKTIQLGDQVFFGNNTYLGGYCDHVLPCLSPTIIVELPPCNERPAVDRTPILPRLVCYDSSRTMSEAQWQEIATQLGVEVALIKAIAWCETGGKGFNESGKPIIRIEASWLKRFGISPPFRRASNNWEDFEKLLKQGHNLGQTEKYEIALIASTSFGLFQTMGLAYLDYGARVEPDSHWGGWLKDPKLRPKKPEKALGLLRRFKDAMMGNEFNQGQYFVKFVKAKSALLSAMQRLDVLDWCTIAYLYNGKTFVTNHAKEGGYDMALIKYYIQFGGKKQDSANKYKSLYKGKPRPCL
jgi:hypothetical protein